MIRYKWIIGVRNKDKAAGEMLASYFEEYYGNKYNAVNINGR